MPPEKRRRNGDFMDFRKLPIRNLVRRPGRTAALVLLVLLLSFTMFGGALTLLSIRGGTKSLEGRLGADIIVVPSEMASKVNLDNVLLMGTTGSYYMKADILDQIRAVEGVEKASAQLFMASLRASCCSVAVQVIGFDPEEDFTVQPWITRSFKRGLGDMEVLVGSRVSTEVGGNIRIYEKDCRVAGRLESTGTQMDTAVYATIDTVRTLIKAAEDLGHDLKLPGDPSELVSAVYVKVSDGASADNAAGYINGHIRRTEAIRTKNMLTDVSDSMAGVSFVMTILIAAVWLLVFFLILIAFLMILRERKKEFASLRVLGASSGMLSGMVFRETAIISFTGGLAGIALACLIVFPFSALIEKMLDLPFLRPAAGTIAGLAVGTLVMCMITGIIASAWSAYKLGHVDVSMILREE